ncbi:MAG: phosphonopyruvate decarboxylase [Cytophagaceae bacterium]|jgi:phosphonopyruvate decarboxylase|nr:phosphonopyruvate decarboxylase [Cytophagaceae bacterium]
MIDVSQFVKILEADGVNFFTGVPDSLLKDFCAYIDTNIGESRHITAASEGGAVAMATGYHLATGGVPLVYMQNSGLGNAVNPLLSLADREVYGISMLLLIGWRGDPDGANDEPQHIKQGRIQNALLDAMEIPYTVIDKDTADIETVIKDKIRQAKTLMNPVAIVVRKGTFSEYPAIRKERQSSFYEMTREEAIEIILASIPDNVKVVATTGKASREVFEIRERSGNDHASDFLTVGSMGHSSMIAFGMAIARPNEKIVCLDGDGAAIMQLGAISIIGTMAPKNLMYIVLNNGCHESVGGQPTVGFEIDFLAIARACGYKYAFRFYDARDLGETMKSSIEWNEPIFIEVRLKTGSRSNLGRPTITPLQNKLSFMEAFLRTE